MNKNSFKTELTKALNFPLFKFSFFIFLLLFVFLIVFSANTSSPIYKFFFSEDIKSFEYLQFPYVWKTFTWIAGWINHLWALLIIILIGNELRLDSLKKENEVIISWDLLKSKLSFYFLIPLFLAVLILFFALFYGIKYTPELTFPIIFKNIIYLVTYFIQSIGYISFALMLYFLVKSTNFAIITYLGYLLFEGILRFFMTQEGIGSFIYFLPMKSFSLLTPMPTFRSININLSEIFLNNFPILISIVISIFYLVLFIIISKRKLKK